MIRWLFLLFSCLWSLGGLAQKYTLSGYVSDSTSGEALVGVHIFSEELNTGTTTNEYGFFSISFTVREVGLTASYTGYKPKTRRLLLDRDTLLDIRLTTRNILEAIVVTESERERSGRPGGAIPVSSLEAIPIIGGETDILKALSFFPGVSTGQEGSSNLYIRGGTPDQNLILIDGIPVYNVNHLGGFFSVFNADAVKNIELFKGSFPARYGGRLSSVIDITMKEGNREAFNGKVGIGLLTSQVALEGPLKKGRSSYLLTARTSYLGLINGFRKKSEVENYLDYWLYDINAKLNFELERGKLFFSVYTGNDTGINYSNAASSVAGNRVLAFATDESKVDWGNTIISSRYVLPVGPNLFGKFLVGFSQYRYRFRNESVDQTFLATDTLVERNAFQNFSLLNDFLFQVNFDHAVGGGHFLKYGAGLTLHRFNTGVSNELDAPAPGNSLRSEEFYLYLEDNFPLSSWVSANIGLRWSGLQAETKTYSLLEPRLSFRLQPTGLLSFHTSFARTGQYIHLLVNDGFGFPNDIWAPATDRTPPQIADQVALGGELLFPGDFLLSIEGFYKKMRQLIDYREGVDMEFARIDNWESLIERNGEGTAYGVEWLLQKKAGRLNGFIAYTLSWNNRQFENINQGNPYPFTYDRRHDFSIVFQYHVSQKWTLSSNWVFQTGTAVSLPVASLPLPGGVTSADVFTARNNGRMPAYHRLDLGITHRKITKKDNEFIWRASFYNVYNRRNPSFLLVHDTPVLNENDQFLYHVNQIKQISLFTFIPALSLAYKFQR